MDTAESDIKVTCKACARLVPIEGCNAVGRCAVDGSLQLLRPQFACRNYKKLSRYIKKKR